ncbi:hypothetical protein IGI37_000544 [Enterococcus sp. AZ194]|uniref:GH92 family glycosyl hydrolase n=1 Tax=Enterococcus sp. AZ194 TaxID=2774629 RepID=UPI003F26ED0F
MNVTSIDTRHATSNSFELSRGNCFPFTGVPFGMNYFGIETHDDNWWFHPEASHYRGIRLSHQPTMWAGTKGDFCSVRLLPFTKNTKGLTVVPYAPENSEFHPNYLKIYQKNNQLETVVTPSDYGALITMDSPQDEKGLMVSFPTEGVITKAQGTVIEGYSKQLHTHRTRPLKLYFHIETSSKIVSFSEKDTQVYEIVFSDAESVELRMGTSFISKEYAIRNLPTESAENMLMHVTKLWEDKLNKIEVTDADPDKVATFYHNMYRAFLYPQRLYEFDEAHQPVHRDAYSNEVKSGYLYMNNGFWDTARTVYPLFSLIEMDEYPKILEGFLNSYRESGFLPKWLSPEDSGGMPGNYIDAVIADAASKKIVPDLMPEFLQGMIHSAEVQEETRSAGRSYVHEYNEYGYVPSDLHESVNHTLDYSYSDYCISVVAKTLGEEKIANEFAKRSYRYQNLFSKKDQFMVARDRDGKFKEEFSPFSWGGDYTEGSAWHSSFAVSHDIQGLIELYGGLPEFEKILTRLANTRPEYTVEGYGHVIHEMAEMEVNGFGQINVGNQPSFHLPYLFSFIHKPYFMQPLLKQAVSRLFSAGWKGYPGDEDNGSMSTWYLFNALGFYPFCPGSKEYLFGMPNFDQAIIHLSNGNRVVLKTELNYPQQQFINRVKTSGGDYRNCFISHDELLSGTELTFELGMVPNIDCFNEKVPFSMSQHKDQ